MLLEVAAAPRFEMVGFGDAEGFGRLPGGLAVTEPCRHATMGPKLAAAFQLAVCGCARRHGEASIAATGYAEVLRRPESRLDGTVVVVARPCCALAEFRSPTAEAPSSLPSDRKVRQ